MSSGSEFNNFSGNLFYSKDNMLVEVNNNWNSSSTGNAWELFDSEPEGCVDLDIDGFCDDSYEILGGITDYLPIYVNDDESPHILSCSSCEECSLLIQEANYSNIIVRLTNDIVDDVGSCIDFAQKDGMIFDCQGHTIGGDDVYSPSDDGIKLYHSVYNTVRNCEVDQFYDGISNDYSGHNVFSDIFSYDNHNYGLNVYYSNKVLVNNSNFSNNLRGIYSAYSDYSIFMNNRIFNNSNYGMYVYGFGGVGQENMILNNYFYNDVNYYYYSTIYSNFLNTSLTSFVDTNEINIIGMNLTGGNFWGKPDGSGYSQTCVDSQADGICDVPYTLVNSNIDNYPLCLFKDAPVYIYTTPNNGAKIGKDLIDFRIFDSTLSISDVNISINGVYYILSDLGAGIWNYTFSNFSNTEITSYTFKVYYSGGELEERNFTYYLHNVDSKKLPAFGVFSFFSMILVISLGLRKSN